MRADRLPGRPKGRRRPGVSGAQGVEDPGRRVPIGWAPAAPEGRAISTHFGDAGLAGHLLVFADCARRPVPIFHYRTHAGAEADFAAARGSRLLPIEVKSAATVPGRDLGGMRSFLDDFRAEAPFGVVLTGGPEVLPPGNNVLALPLARFLEGAP